MCPTSGFSAPILRHLRPSSCQPLQIPSLLHSQPTFSPLLSVSPTSSQSFQMWFRPTVSRPLNLVTELLTIYSRNLVLRCSRRLDVWTWRSWRPPSESFPPWRKPGSFATLTLLGLRLFIWLRRRTEAGALVESCLLFEESGGEYLDGARWAVSGHVTYLSIYKYKNKTEGVISEHIQNSFVSH